MKKETNKSLTKKIIKLFIGIIIGGVLGFLYYRFFIAYLDSNMINNSPLFTTAYGVAVGALLGLT